MFRGAGRGMALIDIHGNIWPCHRWNKAAHSCWRIGNIYEGFSEEARKKMDVRNQIVQLSPNCQNCSTKIFCSGGCPAENLESSGDVFSPIENTCRINRIIADVGRDLYNELVQENNQVVINMFRKQLVGKSEENDTYKS